MWSKGVAIAKQYLYQSNCDNTIFSLRYFSDMLYSAALAAVGTMC